MKILAVFAHPDDESFGPGGTLARAASEGHEVSVLTMTRGESGSLGISKRLDNQELARRRTGELQCAAGKLGIQNLKILDYPDKSLNRIPSTEGVKTIREVMDGILPDLVITFHENSISGHSDHKTVTDWTFRSVQSQRNAPRLLVYGLTGGQISQITHRQLMAMRDEEITHKIDVREYLKLKIEAIQCHSTQNELWKQMQQLEGDYENFASWEYFSQKLPHRIMQSISSTLFDESE